MRLSLLGISISLLGIAIILTSVGSAESFGLMLSFVGFIISLVSCFLGEIKKVKGFLK